MTPLMYELPPPTLYEAEEQNEAEEGEIGCVAALPPSDSVKSDLDDDDDE